MTINEILAQLTPGIVAILVTLLGLIASVLGLYAKRILANLEDTQKENAIRDIIADVVIYVEQKGKEWGSDLKFETAKQKALEWINSKGLIVSETQLEIMIEAFVHEFTEHYQKTPENGEIEAEV